MGCDAREPRAATMGPLPLVIIVHAIHTYIDEHRKCQKPRTNIDQPMPVQPRAPRHATFQRAADGRADSDFLCRLRATREADIAKRV